MFISRRFVSFLFIAAFAATFGYPTRAAEAPLTWEEVRKLALEKNTSLSGALLSKKSSEAAVKGAYGSFLPTVSLNADRTRSRTELNSVSETRKTDLRYGATAALNLFNGFGTIAALKKARAGDEEATASYEVTSAALRRDLRVAYFNIYQLQERIRLNERALKREQQNVKLLELKYNSGSEARWNLRKKKAELERAVFTLNNSKSQLVSARETLASLLQLDSLPPRSVPPPDARLLQATALAREPAVESHPELRRSRFAGERLEQDITIARSSLFPSLGLSYTRSWLESNPDGSARSRTNSTSFVISADWNIFNGATDFYKIQQANLSSEAATLATSGLERQLRANILTRSATYRQAAGLLPVSRALREAAEERERTVSEQYRAGLKTYLDWEQAESQLLEAEQAEIKALGESLVAFADLEQAMGLSLEQP